MAAVVGLSIAGVLAAVLLLLCIPVSFTAAYRTGEPPEGCTCAGSFSPST